MKEISARLEIMNHLLLKRRELLRLGLLTGIVGLTGCGIRRDKPILRTSREILPKEFLQELPNSWQIKYMGLDSSIDQDRFVSEENPTDLLALEDGWLSKFAFDELLAIDSEKLFPKLNNQARKLLDIYKDSDATKIFPVGVSPWVMIFRNGEAWIQKARESWDVLLEPGLKGHLVLPNSPRLVISIADKIAHAEALRKLIGQAKTFDDRNALNWVLAGKARVAVLPLKRCMKSLIRDPRLSVVLPKEGAPLNWTVLLRPRSSSENLPISWLEESWTSPILDKLLSRGWIAPLSYSRLVKARGFIRKDLQPIVLPSENVWENCWSFPPLNDLEQKTLVNRWISSIS